MDAGWLRIAIPRPISDNSKGQDFSLGHCVRRGASINEETWQLLHQGDPTTVIFLIVLPSQTHFFASNCFQLLPL